MTPAQHRALERIVAADAAGHALKIGRDNTAATVAQATADALIRRDLADRTRIPGKLGAWIVPTDDGRKLAAEAEPIGETR